MTVKHDRLKSLIFDLFMLAEVDYEDAKKITNHALNWLYNRQKRR